MFLEHISGIGFFTCPLRQHVKLEFMCTCKIPYYLLSIMQGMKSSIRYHV